MDKFTVAIEFVIQKTALILSLAVSAVAILILLYATTGIEPFWLINAVMVFGIGALVWAISGIACVILTNIRQSHEENDMDMADDE